MITSTSAPDVEQPMACLGPVRVLGRAGAPVCATVGDRVKAYWQRFGYIIGSGTVVGFQADNSGHVKVLVETDTPGHEIVRWDWDRTERCTGHWEDETVAQSVGRWRAYLAGEQG